MRMQRSRKIPGELHRLHPWPAGRLQVRSPRRWRPQPPCCARASASSRRCPRSFCRSASPSTASRSWRSPSTSTGATSSRPAASPATPSSSPSSRSSSPARSYAAHQLLPQLARGGQMSRERTRTRALAARRGDGEEGRDRRFPARRLRRRRLRARRGRRRRHSIWSLSGALPSRSTSTSPATPTWRAGSRCCWASSCPSTSSSRIWRETRRSSGGVGTFRLGDYLYIPLGGRSATARLDA